MRVLGGGTEGRLFWIGAPVKYWRVKGGGEAEPSLKKLNIKAAFPDIIQVPRPSVLDYKINDPL